MHSIPFEFDLYVLILQLIQAGISKRDTKSKPAICIYKAHKRNRDVYFNRGL